MSQTFINYPSDTNRITQIVSPGNDLNGSAAALNASIKALTDAIVAAQAVLAECVRNPMTSNLNAAGFNITDIGSLGTNGILVNGGTGSGTAVDVAGGITGDSIQVGGPGSYLSGNVLLQTLVDNMGNSPSGSGLNINFPGGTEYGIVLENNWIDMPLDTYAGIGDCGNGDNAWVASCNGNGAFFPDSLAGDIAYRRASPNTYNPGMGYGTSSRLLFGANNNGGANAGMILSGATLNDGINNLAVTGGGTFGSANQAIVGSDGNYSFHGTDGTRSIDLCNGAYAVQAVGPTSLDAGQITTDGLGDLAIAPTSGSGTALAVSGGLTSLDGGAIKTDGAGQTIFKHSTSSTIQINPQNVGSGSAALLCTGPGPLWGLNGDGSGYFAAGDIDLNGDGSANFAGGALSIDTSGNLNTSGQITATGRVSGKLNLAGTVSGTPSGGNSGDFLIDDTAHKLWINFSGTWKSVALS
jgi:hypothetical protein